MCLQLLQALPGRVSNVDNDSMLQKVPRNLTQYLPVAAGNVLSSVEAAS